MANDPLKRYYSDETIEKLERFVSQQETQHQLFPLPLLRLCALVVATIGDQAVTHAIAGPEDQAPFAFGLDQAGREIADLIQELEPGVPSQVKELLHLIETHVYGLSAAYWQRREHIRTQGKEGLLVRISAQLAEQRLKP